MRLIPCVPRSLLSLPVLLLAGVSPAEVAVTREEVTTVSGETEPGALVSLTDAFRTQVLLKADDTGRYCFTGVPLREGLNRLVIRTVEPTGRTRESVREIVRDTAQPTVRIVSPDTGALTRRRRFGVGWGRPHPLSVNVVIESEFGATVEFFVNNESRGTTEVGQEGRAHFVNMRLPQTQIWLSARATDRAGNVGRASRVWLGQPKY